MDDKVPLVPMPVEVIEYQGHLFIHHSYYVPSNNDDLGELVGFHDEEHGGSLAITHPHGHLPVPPEEEWTWE